MLAAFVAQFPFRVLQGVLAGLQDLGFTNLAALGTYLGSSALTVVMVLRGHGLWAMAASWVFTELAMSLVCLVRLWRRFPEALPRRLAAPSLEVARAWLRQSLWMSLGQVANLLDERLGFDGGGQGAGAGGGGAVRLHRARGGAAHHRPQMILANAQPALAELRMSAPRERIAGVRGAAAGDDDRHRRGDRGGGDGGQ